MCGQCGTFSRQRKFPTKKKKVKIKKQEARSKIMRLRLACLLAICHLTWANRLHDATRADRDTFDLADAQEAFTSLRNELGEGNGGDVYACILSHPYILGTLTELIISGCDKSCAKGQCKGSGMYDCTKCPTGRMLDPIENMTSGEFKDHGMCTGDDRFVAV